MRITDEERQSSPEFLTTTVGEDLGVGLWVEVIYLPLLCWTNWDDGKNSEMKEKESPLSKNKPLKLQYDKHEVEFLVEDERNNDHVLDRKKACWHPWLASKRASAQENC